MNPQTVELIISVIAQGEAMSTRTRLVLSKTVLTVVLSALPTFGSATHSWGVYHWAVSSYPFTVHLGDNVSSKWSESLGTASNDWNLSFPNIPSRLRTSVELGGVDNTKRCKPTVGRVEVCSNSYGNNGWLGIAQIWLSGSHITQGAVKLNDSYFNTAKYNKPEWRHLVMCQEIGHTFGLDHQDETFDNANLGTCMDYTNKPLGPPSNEHPNTHDYEQLGIIYNHTHATTSAQTASRGTPSATGEANRSTGIGTAEWGRLIRSTNGGRTERFELDLGNGQKVVTFVIWAD